MKPVILVILLAGQILQTATAQWTASEPANGSTLATATSGETQDLGAIASLQFVCNHAGLVSLWPGENVRIWIDKALLPWGAYDLDAQVFWTTEDRTGEPMTLSVMKQQGLTISSKALLTFKDRELAVVRLTTSDYLRLEFSGREGVQYKIPFSLIGANRAIDATRKYCVQ